MEHVVIRKLEHLTGSDSKPALGYAIETRDRPGPAHKQGAFPDDMVWIQLHGGLFVGKARVRIAWVGEYSSIREVRARTQGSRIFDVEDFWTGRPRYGYAAIAELQHEAWVEPFWAGPRTYGYEWVLLEDDKKHASWLTRKPPPRSATDLRAQFMKAFS
ncbi:MAG: hypothetical protein ACRDJI_02185 [Actinomycetota bacterium]